MQYTHYILDSQCRLHNDLCSVQIAVHSVCAELEVMSAAVQVCRPYGGGIVTLSLSLSR